MQIILVHLLLLMYNQFIKSNLKVDIYKIEVESAFSPKLNAVKTFFSIF